MRGSCYKSLVLRIPAAFLHEICSRKTSNKYAYENYYFTKKKKNQQQKLWEKYFICSQRNCEMQKNKEPPLHKRHLDAVKK